VTAVAPKEATLAVQGVVAEEMTVKATAEAAKTAQMAAADAQA